MTNDQPSAIDHGAWIPFLIRKRRFAERMILAAECVEDLTDQMVGMDKLSAVPYS